MFGEAEWAAIALSLRVAFFCVLVVSVPSIALAHLLARRDFPGKTLVNALIHLPLVLPPVVTGYLLLLLLGRHGPLGGLGLSFTWFAAVLASALMGMPLMVRSVRLAIELVDPGLEAAARSLGATPFHVLRTVTVPLALPGIVTGGVLAFARSLGEFGATITVAGNIPFETQTLPAAVYSYSQVPGGEAAALRLVLVSVGLSLCALVASEMLARRVRRSVEGRP